MLLGLGAEGLDFCLQQFPRLTCATCASQVYLDRREAVRGNQVPHLPLARQMSGLLSCALVQTPYWLHSLLDTSVVHPLQSWAHLAKRAELITQLTLMQQISFWWNSPSSKKFENTVLHTFSVIFFPSPLLHRNKMNHPSALCVFYLPCALPPQLSCPWQLCSAQCWLVHVPGEQSLTPAS